MGHTPRVSVFAATADRALADRLVLHLATRRRRGELGAIRLYLVGEDSRYPGDDSPHLAVVVLDREGALPGRLARLLQGERGRSQMPVKPSRPGAPPLLAVPAPSKMALLHMRPGADPPALDVDPPGALTVLPRDGLPLLGRDDEENAWDCVLEDIVSIAKEIPCADEAVPLPLLDRPPFRVPFVRDLGFVGRAAELARLHEHLQAGQIVTLRPSLDCGGSGAGVRALAVEYAYRYASSFPAGVFWGTYRPDRDFVRIHSRRTFEAWGAPHDAISMITAWEEVLAAADRPDALLIADSGEARAPLEALATLAGRVVILTALYDTSTPSPVINVGPIDEEAALEYLLPFVAGDRGAAAALSVGLGRLPLALRLATGHLAAHPDLEARRYLEQLALPEVDLTRSAALERAFTLAWEPLRDTVAGALLQTIAALPGSRPVPPARLVLSAGIDAAAATQYLEQLIALGLLARLTDGDVVLHRRLVSTARATIEEPGLFGHSIARRVLTTLSDAVRLADEVLARGVSSVIEDLHGALAQLDLHEDYDLRRAIEALEVVVGGAARMDHDRPLSRAAFLQQLGSPRGPWDHEQALPALHAQVAELLKAEPGPRLALRKWLRPARRSPNFEQAGIAALSADGVSALISDSGGNVTLWDVRRTEPVRTVACETEPMRKVALAADGLIYAVATASLSRIDLWDIVSGRRFHQIPISGHGSQFWALTLTPSGRFLAATTNAGDVQVVDLREPERVRLRALPKDGHRSTRHETPPLLSSNGSRVVLPLGDSPRRSNAELWVWDLFEDIEWTKKIAQAPTPGQIRRRMLRSMSDRNHQAILSADGQKAFSVSPWDTLLTWDLNDPGPPRDRDSFLYDVHGLAMTADAVHLVMLSSIRDHGAMRWHRHCARRSVQIVSLRSGHTVAELLLDSDYHDPRLAVAADAQNIVILGNGIQFIEWINPPGEESASQPSRSTK